MTILRIKTFFLFPHSSITDIFVLKYKISAFAFIFFSCRG